MVIVGGEKNYGSVSAGDKYQREVKKDATGYATRVEEIGKIDINHGAEIEVTGKESIGYAMLSGIGTNAGTIKVTGPTTNTATPTAYNGSIGFYGVKGTFTNTSTGKIITDGTLAHSVVVKNAGMILEL